MPISEAEAFGPTLSNKERKMQMRLDLLNQH